MMTTKKDAKRRKRAKKKSKRKVKSAQALFIEKMKKSNDVPGGKIVVEPKGEEKMSEIILHFAKPFLDECEDEESVRKAIGLAVIIWNVSLLPKINQDQEIQRICSALSPSHDATDLATAMHYVDMLLERKKKYFSNNKRSIINYQISGSSENRRLDVASTLSP